jgi:hypothetical protein
LRKNFCVVSSGKEQFPFGKSNNSGEKLVNFRKARGRAQREGRQESGERQG